MSEKVILIDGHSILNRAFYGVPELTNSAGLHTNAIYGFLNILFKLLDEENPDYLIVAFDEHAPTFRHKIYAEYKGTRKAMADELREQVPVLQELLAAMRVETVKMAGYEADDLLGTLAKKSEAAGMEVSLVSGDRDLLQIASDHIRIRLPRTRSGKTTIDDFYANDVLEQYKVTPEQFIELKALMGDSSDNIPGVPKVGEKTATELMVTYGSLDSIYQNLENISKNSIRESLREHRELAELSKTLATIKTDCEVELDREAARAEGYFTPEAYEIVKRLELKSYFGRFEDAVKDGTAANQAEIVWTGCACLADFRVALAEASARADVAQKPVGMQILTEDGAFVCAALVWDGEEDAQRGAYFADALGAVPESELQGAFAEFVSRVRIATTFLKSQYVLFPDADPGQFSDLQIAAYLVNPLKSDYDAEAIASEYLGRTIPSRKELLGKRSLRDAAVSAPEALARLARDAAACCKDAAPRLLALLAERGMDELYREMEMPLTRVLYEMERLGVEVRREELAVFSRSLTGKIAELEQKIHREAGEDFNINSPKQLGEILFDRMKLPGGKKTKTGYSTAADVLEKLAPEVPFVADVLEYRGLVKLQNTYADALPEFIAPDGRIHSTFHQTVTATGRLSSADPNLQNIPVRTELGRELRKVFVAREGCVFVDADYSQIELRVLASLSGDESLIEAYRSEQDIHRITAAKVFGVPFEDVTDLQRRSAKAVNFGIVYGISSFGLSQDLSISRQEASEYISQYFETYPGIKGYLDGLVESAKKRGYSETYFGRRRPIPELSSSNYMQRSFGERVAMNAPIQGTAADIIKRAMLAVYRELKERGLKSRLILQVHDELILEAPEAEEEAVRELLIRNMQGAADLAVKLEVGIGSGRNWFEAH